jgi:hypothetical protein
MPKNGKISKLMLRNENINIMLKENIFGNILRD